MGENYITCQDEKGSINISEEVINSMVRTAVCEVEGVSGLSNTAGAELAERMGIKTVARGIKVQMAEDVISADVIITVTYGCNIVKVATDVQERVIAAVQTATGIDKVQVNVHVAGIAFDK